MWKGIYMNNKFKYAFAASLLLNVLLIGVLLGQFSQRFEPGFRHRHQHSLMQQLPESLHSRFREQMQAMRTDHREIRRQVRAAREEAIRILIAEPFDAGAYDRQVQLIHELSGQMHQRMAETVKQLAQQLTPQERAALAQMLRHPPPRHGRLLE
jgi:uncharacterized membrane protein